MRRKGLSSSLLSALLLIAIGGCGDDENNGDGGANTLDSSTDEGVDAGRDAYVWMPNAGSGGSGGTGGAGGAGGTGGGSGLDGRMCAAPRDYLPESFLPRCSADTAACIAGCMSSADPEACRDGCISSDATPPESQFGLNCGACIYLTLFACIDMEDCHDGVAEVFCCIEDNCPTGSAEGCSDQMCGGEIQAAVTCGYYANQDCVDLLGDEIGRCFAGLGDEDAGL
jgi:hypothetical protein